MSSVATAAVASAAGGTRRGRHAAKLSAQVAPRNAGSGVPAKTPPAGLSGRARGVVASASPCQDTPADARAERLASLRTVLDLLPLEDFPEAKAMFDDALSRASRDPPSTPAPEAAPAHEAAPEPAPYRFDPPTLQQLAYDDKNMEGVVMNEDGHVGAIAAAMPPTDGVLQSSLQALGVHSSASVVTSRRSAVPLDTDARASPSPRSDDAMSVYSPLTSAASGMKRLRVDSSDSFSLGGAELVVAAGGSAAAPMGPILDVTIAADAEELGSGSYATVKVGVTPNGTAIAVKEAHYKHNSEAIVGRVFASEAAVWRTLLKYDPHPHVVQPLGFGLPARPGQPAPLIMALARGGTVRQRLLRLGRRFNAYEARHLLVGAVRGLLFLHGLRYVHRDIKIENIVFGLHNAVTIIDVGGAVSLPPGMASLRVSARNAACSLHSVPPEFYPALVGADVLVSEKADLWALGTTIAVVLTGDLLRDGDMSFRPETGMRPHFLNFDVPALPAAPPGADPELVRLVADLAEVVAALRTVKVEERPSTRELVEMPAMARLMAGCPCSPACVCRAAETLGDF